MGILFKINWDFLIFVKVPLIFFLLLFFMGLILIIFYIKKLNKSKLLLQEHLDWMNWIKQDDGEIEDDYLELSTNYFLKSGKYLSNDKRKNKFDNPLF